MLKSIIKSSYHLAHDIAFDTIQWNPFFPSKRNDKKIKYGHISSEHLSDSRLDYELIDSLTSAGINVEEFDIDIAEYKRYVSEAHYPDYYFGGGKDDKQNFIEKSLEHYVSTQFMDINENSVFIDIAACNSPFHQIIQNKYGVKNSYQQDLIFKKGLNGNKIGGYAHELPFKPNSIDAITLHCSLEHFEGDSDILFFQSVDRLLRPGGRVIILPFYLAYEYTIHVDPIYNFIKRHRVKLDNNSRFRLRYANWYQFYSRHYDPQALKDRIINNCPNLNLKVYKVNNFKDVDKNCYLRFVGILEKK